MRYFLLLLLLICTLVIQAQKGTEHFQISTRTQAVVDSIAKDGILKGEYVGMVGDRPKQWDNFLALRKTATKKELLYLTDYPISTVKCYAFWAIAYRKPSDILSIIFKHITDTSSVETLFGCEGSKIYTTGFFIDLVTPNYVDLNVRKLNSSQLKQLDSAVLSSHNQLLTKTFANWHQHNF